MGEGKRDADVDWERVGMKIGMGEGMGPGRVRGIRGKQKQTYRTRFPTMTETPISLPANGGPMNRKRFID